MKDHILCVIDFSESSLHSLSWANKIAGCTNAHLAVLFSYRLIPTGNVADIVSFRQKTEEEAKEKFLALLETLSNVRDVSRSFITEIGFYSDNIEKYIRKNPSTIVVLSAGMANEIYDHKGQTFFSFLKQLKAPMLIVPDTPEAGNASQFPTEEQTIAGKIPV